MREAGGPSTGYGAEHILGSARPTGDSHARSTRIPAQPPGGEGYVKIPLRPASGKDFLQKTTPYEKIKAKGRDTPKDTPALASLRLRLRRQRYPVLRVSLEGVGEGKPRLLRFGERAGVTTATVARIERDQIEPRMTTLRKRAQALEVDPAELVE